MRYVEWWTPSGMCSDKVRDVQKAIGDRVASGGKPEDILCLYSENSLEFVQQIIAKYYEELEEAYRKVYDDW